MKTWLITGCSSGFGKELAKLILAQGDAVIATARNTDSLADLSGEVLKLQLDVTDLDHIKQAVTQAKEWKGSIDVLVNNAGFGGVGAIEETSAANYKQMFDVNVFGLVNITKAVLPIMRAQKSGHILNLSSVAGIVSMPGFGPYCATKHAVEALSEALAGEVAEYGINVTIIEPGAFRTNFVGNAKEDNISDTYKTTVGQTHQMLKDLEKTASGDPVKAAKAMIDVVAMEKPPLRLVLGKDALMWANQKIDSLKEQVNAFVDITTGTDFD